MAVISQGMAPSLNYRPVSGGFGLPTEPAVAAPLQTRQRRQQFVLTNN
ncbi:MAG: hypothetical protein R3A10_00010 [Caldilineaceae bacterium]